ncbi:MAG: tetratricopeptide repeat protein [Muribaculaceae bacterium]|nr:tetratricopeptide repeat protein [Muribaculaceae bacterium]
MNFNNRILPLLISLVALATMTLSGCGKSDEPAQPEAQSTKAERNLIREGNSLFADENYADAEIAYSKALQANPASAPAAYNMGLAIAKQAAEGDTTGLAQRADSLFNHAAQLTHDKKLKSMAYYNMGNISYNAQQYERAIQAYQNALRNVPTDDDARYNLRMAQLKLQEQQQQQQNQDKNQQNQNQDQQNQQNQDQPNQDQQDKQQGQDQQGKQDQAKPEQGKEQQEQAQQGQGQPINMDERSVQQVLKAMQDKEKATQQKIYQMGEQQRQRERQATRNKW